VIGDGLSVRVPDDGLDAGGPREIDLERKASFELLASPRLVDPAVVLRGDPDVEAIVELRRPDARLERPVVVRRERLSARAGAPHDQRAGYGLVGQRIDDPSSDVDRIVGQNLRRRDVRFPRRLGFRLG
jgi:hypothetical protein